MEALEFFTRGAVQYPNAAHEPLANRPCERPGWSRKVTVLEDYDGVREIPGVLQEAYAIVHGAVNCKRFPVYFIVELTAKVLGLRECVPQARRYILTPRASGLHGTRSTMISTVV